MDEIAQQLRSEIRSLEDHIRRTEGRFLATHWAGQLLDPFERIEAQLDDDDLRAAVAAFHHARTRFHVNGRLAERIDQILIRHAELVPDATRAGAAAQGTGYDQVVLTPDGDPGDTSVADDAGSLFVEEDEELADGDAPLPALDLAVSPLDAEGLAVRGAPSLHGADGGPTEVRDAGVPSAPTEGADDLFTPAAPGPAADEGQAPGGDELFAGGPRPAGAGGGARSRASTPAHDPKAVEPSSIFAHAIGLDDLSAGLDIIIPQADRTAFDQKLRARMNDRVVASLRNSRMAEGQYILLPRMARFATRDGGVIPCTVRNLARRYIALFGEIRDLMRYRNDAMMSSEVPEPGWALITAESPRESLGKNYMEQNQYLRYLATSLGIPSHLLRRRTMVETLYDLIVGRLVLGQRLQRATLDWTSSSPAKNDFVCLYYPEEGIRLRDLSRITHHRSLGVTPNW